jgi:beta-lactamase regulating signal transducer with metallopeptidase domain
MTSLLLQHLIVTTLLAAIVWCLCKAVRLSPAAQHVLWSLVLLKLLIPPMGEIGVAWPVAERAAAPTETVTARQEPSPPLRIPSEAVAAPMQTETFNEPVAAASATSPAPVVAPIQPTPAPQSEPVNYVQLLLALWACGAFVMAFLQLLRWQRFHADVSPATAAPDWLSAEADDVARLLECKRVPVEVCKRLSTPAVTGTIRPRILIPEALLERIPRDRWRALLAHEVAHVKRRDVWWRMLELAAGIVWFWNPVFWLARKHTRANAELACDAWVVWAMPDERRAYADALIDVSEWASAPAFPATAVGMSAASRSKLESRLKVIVAGNTRRSASRRLIVAAMALLIASLPGWALDERRAETLESESKPESNPMHMAQAETPPEDESKKTDLAKKLDEPVSIEFDNEHVQTILEFLSGYVGLNIVLDHGVIGQEKPREDAEMDVVHVGPHWFRKPTPEHLGTAEWPQVSGRGRHGGAVQ